MVTKHVSLALCLACAGLVASAQDGAQKTQTKKKAPPKVEVTKFTPPKIVKDNEVAPPSKPPKVVKKPKANVPPPPPPPKKA